MQKFDDVGGGAIKAHDRLLGLVPRETRRFPNLRSALCRPLQALFLAASVAWRLRWDLRG